MLSEADTLKILIVAGGMVVFAYVWLTVLAGRRSKLWAIPPFPLLFVPFHFQKAASPFMLALLGGSVAGGAVALHRVFDNPAVPYEKTIDGEIHLVLTGVPDFDYAVLKTKTDPKYKVLFLANPDVTDDTLKIVAEMKGLRELDLHDTKITDAGLATLRQLPALQELNLANTAVTDEGFVKHLREVESLMKLDATGTNLSRAVLVEWKKLKTGRRYVN